MFSISILCANFFVILKYWSRCSFTNRYKKYSKINYRFNELQVLFPSLLNAQKIYSDLNPACFYLNYTYICIPLDCNHTSSFSQYICWFSSTIILVYFKNIHFSFIQFVFHSFELYIRSNFKHLKHWWIIWSVLFIYK